MHINAASVIADNPPAFGEAKAKTAAGLAAGIKWVKQMLAFFFRKSGAIIANGNLHGPNRRGTSGVMVGVMVVVSRLTDFAV